MVECFTVHEIARGSIPRTVASFVEEKDMETLRDKLNNLPKAYQDFLEMHLTDGSEPIQGKTLVADGWTYKDLPWLDPDQYETFLRVVGVENIEFLTHAVRGLKQRGQMFLSPTGQENLRKYLEGN